MQPGRSPKPTLLRVLEGNPQHRPLPKNEPKPMPKAPAAPASLDARARAYWAELAPELERLGLLTSADGNAFGVYCQACSEWEAADLAIQRHGLTVETKMGTFARPEVRIRDTAAKRMRAFSAEFGLTPSARSRISVNPVGADADDDILS